MVLMSSCFQRNDDFGLDGDVDVRNWTESLMCTEAWSLKIWDEEESQPIISHWHEWIELDLCTCLVVLVCLGLLQSELVRLSVLWGEILPIPLRKSLRCIWTGNLEYESKKHATRSRSVDLDTLKELYYTLETGTLKNKKYEDFQNIRLGLTQETANRMQKNIE